MLYQTSPAPVRFGHCSGFAFDGDYVRLDADVVVTSPLEAVGREWSLRLVATPVSASSPAADITLAELSCGTLYPDEHGRVSISGTTTASLPAGSGEYALSLALASIGPDRLEVCDRVCFARNEAFLVPRLAGLVGYAIDGEIVHVTVERIENPRACDNLSGTLALELWALPAPYQGGAFAGVQFGSVTLGTLAGQNGWTDLALDLPRAALAPGQWQLVLMLREWTPAGYLTRDYCNFALPLDVAEAPPAAQSMAIAAAAERAASPVLPAATAPAPAPAPAPAAAVSAVPAQPVKDTPKAAAPLQSGKDEKTEKTTKTEKAAGTESPVAAVKDAKPSPATKAVPAKAKPADTGVSINTASEAELLALPGLTAKLVKGIIAGRPWAQVNDLIAVKGIGPKMLEKLRALIRA